MLVDDAKPLRRKQLPVELRNLARLHALELSVGRYEYDANRLLTIIQRVLDEASGTGTVHQPPPSASVGLRPDESALGHAAQKEPGAVQKDQARTIRILTDAVRLAYSITDEYSKASALARIAGALAATDPDRAERIAQSIISGSSKVEALVAIVQA